MTSLVKLFVGLVVLAALAYLVFLVPLGGLTLYQHLAGISRTDEARALGGAIEQETGKVVEKVGAEVSEAVETIRVQGAARLPGATDAGQATHAEVGEADRAALDRVIRATDRIEDDDRASLDKLIRERTP